ncbi:MAG: hypothetical protein JRJ49_03440 [Deltaproteobacteria bacterium]|nr:hypothetical protein [Deltaproteobacteria bacterium]
MGKKYYVNDNDQANGDHEVHTEDCKYLPLIESKTYLGVFYSCSDAVAEAKKHYPQSNGCSYCCLACHTS